MRQYVYELRAISGQLLLQSTVWADSEADALQKALDLTTHAGYTRNRTHLAVCLPDALETKG